MMPPLLHMCNGLARPAHVHVDMGHATDTGTMVKRDRHSKNVIASTVHSLQRHKVDVKLHHTRFWQSWVNTGASGFIFRRFIAIGTPLHYSASFEPLCIEIRQRI